MGFINLAEKTISAKLVYYGCGNGGKTTSLEAVHEIMRPEVDLVSIKTEEEATLLFDFLPIDLGVVNGFKIRLQGFTVPGQEKYERMRKYVLSGADAVVFVVDSARSRREENLLSWESLRKNLASNGLSRDSIPLVLQYNKRDLDDILSEPELDDMFRADGSFEAYPSVATEHSGVFEAFVHAAGMLVEQKVRDYGLGKGSVSPEVVAEGAREKLWQIHDEIRARHGGPAGKDADGETRDHLELTFDYDHTDDASEEEIDSLASGDGEILTDEDLDIDLAEFGGGANQGGDRTSADGDYEADDADEAWAVARGPQAGDDEFGPQQLLDSAEEARIGNAALQSSYELARKLGDAQQQFAALDRKNRELVRHTQNVVHDLKKPISVVKLMLQSVQRGLFGEPPKRVKDAIDNGMLAIDNMEQLVGDLLDSSRLDFDGMELQFGTVDMTLLFGQIATSLRFEIDDKDALMRIEPMPRILADAWGLEKVFNNLLGNALQYVHPERRPLIRVSMHERDDHRIFVVSDNGIGIPKQDMPRMFERFERGSNTQSISGTGLGMHIVREIVLGHGGDVWLESEEGEGTRVYVSIPYEPVQPPHSQLA